MLDFEFLVGVDGRGSSPVLMRYKHSGDDLTAGKGVVINGILCINRHTIRDGEEGDIAIGGGIYQAEVDGEYGPLTVLYKPPASAVLTDVAEGNLPFGRLLEGTTDANQRARVYHQPLAFVSED